MGVLSQLWFAMRTRNVSNAGTEDLISLIINENGEEKLNKTIFDSVQDDQDTGKANIYAHSFAFSTSVINSDNLTDSSVQVTIQGDDLWRPEHVLIWGEEVGGRIIPLAAEWDIEEGISTDPDEGKDSFQVRRIWYPIDPVLQRPDKKANITQLLVLMRTHQQDDPDAGTRQNPALEITYLGDRTHLMNIKTDKMKDLRRGQGFLSLPDRIPPAIHSHLVPRWNNLNSVVLKADALVPDPWRPASFYMFGFSTVYQDNGGIVNDPRPGFIMPLVHIPRWDFGWLSIDPSKGESSVSLPLLPLPDFLPGQG